MTNQEPDDYRGALVYTQEYGYKTVTMTVSVAPNEQSYGSYTALVNDELIRVKLFPVRA